MDVTSIVDTTMKVRFSSVAEIDALRLMDSYFASNMFTIVNNMAFCDFCSGGQRCCKQNDEPHS